ncbi:hypothetical protein [Slackia isoflavoniconvertens]|uniref:hypothetical protein n=1 Tax=Slackia isoflavoniconvertens TaxID=572010 RepID=UPI0015F08F40|nr:hypothetical protein [Slackia isoflavoniconvertens]
MLHKTGEVFLTGSIELRTGRGLCTTVDPTPNASLGAIVGATLSTTLGTTFDAVLIILFGPIFSVIVGLAPNTSPYPIFSTAFFLGPSIASSLALDATSSLTVATIVSMARGPFTDPVAMQRRPHGARRA